MDLGSGRRRAGVRSSVVAGSVWERRMKSDQVKGGIKVFNGEEEENQTTQEEHGGVGKGLNLKRGQTTGGAAVGGKRKTWKSESFEPIHIAKGKTEPPAGKSQIPVTKELTTASVDGIKKRPVRVKKGRSEASKEISKSVDGIEKSPIKVRRRRSEIPKGSAELSKEIVESDEGIEKNSVEKQVKTDLIKVINRSSNESGRNSVLDDQEKGNEGSDEATEKNGSDEATENNGSDENCKELGVCEEKVISSTVSIKNTVEDEDIYEDGDEECDEEDEVEEEEEEEEEEEIEVEIEKKRIDIKEMNVPEVPPQKPEPTVDEVKRINHFNNRTSFSSTVNKQPPPVEKRATPIYTNPPSKPTNLSASDDHQSFLQTHNKLQNLVDLVMWRDVPKSAFIFGIGTFIIISSSYTQDLNISFISVISYMGLVYLAAIFLYRSIICRGLVEIDETSCVLGEEEAIWLLKLFLPYLNEFLLRLRALFSGDPATTMKLAVLLFVLARCGSSITIWKMAKLGFFGVFTVPKVCSSYSHQLTAYGKFWIRRFRDAWDSCTHKKAVAMGIFTVVWNLSSTIARIWAAFMLFVALRYYQQAMLDDYAFQEDARPAEETLQARTGHPRPRLRPTVVEPNVPNKLKKRLLEDNTIIESRPICALFVSPGPKKSLA